MEIVWFWKQAGGSPIKKQTWWGTPVCCDVPVAMGHLEMVGAAEMSPVSCCWPICIHQRDKKNGSNRQVWGHLTWSFEHNICPHLLLSLPLCSWLWLVFKVHVHQEQRCVFNSIMGQKKITLSSSVMDNLVFPPSCTFSRFQTIFCKIITAPSCC